jgi:hypothetical protein
MRLARYNCADHAGRFAGPDTSCLRLSSKLPNGVAAMILSSRGLISGLLAAVGATAVYLLLGSSLYNPDGLRVFPGLHRVEVDSQGGLAYRPNPWRTGYEAPNYIRANVQKHFLFPVYAFAAWRIARLFGYSDSGLRSLQVANAVSAGIALALFAVLLASFFGSAWVTPAGVLGLAFSSSFGAMASNIAEVVPAIPWMLLALVLVMRAAGENDPNPGERRAAHGSGSAAALLAGVAFGFSAGFYAISALIGLAVAALALGRRPARAAGVVISMVVTIAAVYCVVLFFAGYHDAYSFWRALTFMPEQGTYGGFKITNLFAVLFGYAGSIFPVLPDDFAGLRHFATLLRGAGGRQLPVLASISVIVAGSALFALALFRVRARLDVIGRKGVGLGLAVFAGALVASLLWDPYHAKFWMYSNVGLWLASAGYLDYRLRSRDRCRPATVTLTFLVLLVVVGIGLTTLARRHGPNRKWDAAREIAELTGFDGRAGGNDRLIIGGWEPEFDYLTLLVPDRSLLSLPDLFLENHRDESRFAQTIDGSAASVFEADGRVFFVNLFNQDSLELRRSYVERLGFPGFAAWVESVRPHVRAVWHSERDGIVLYLLDREFAVRDR